MRNSDWLPWPDYIDLVRNLKTGCCCLCGLSGGTIQAQTRVGRVGDLSEHGGAERSSTTGAA